MSRRPSSASGSGYRLCLLSLLAVRGPGAAPGCVTVSGPVAALVPVTFSGLGAAIGLVAVFVTFSGPGEARVPVSLSVPGAALGLVNVTVLGAALAAVVPGPGAALGLVTVSAKPLCPLPSLALVRPLGVLPPLLMVRPRCPLPLPVLICDPWACDRVRWDLVQPLDPLPSLWS